MKQIALHNKHKFHSISGRACLCVLLILMYMGSCGPAQEHPVSKEQEFTIDGFTALSNLKDREADGDLSLLLDYNNAIQGFVIPAEGQLEGDAFTYTFRIKNESGEACSYSYKVYYQNESYKFPEFVKGKSGNVQHAYAQENFYGSWENNSEGFRTTGMIPADNDFHSISGTFRIAGNPRDEARFFSEGDNDRWKRNPRVGRYSFLLVVYESGASQYIPDYMADLSISHDSTFIHPYFYFCYQNHQPIHFLAQASTDTLQVIARVPLDKGIYIDPLDFQGNSVDRFFRPDCGNDETLHKNAGIKQFIHYVDSSSMFDNIPVIADIHNDLYGLTDYNWNKAFTAKNEMVRTLPVTVDCPCEEVFTDSLDGGITLINKAASWGKWKKQNAGIITRHGLTYGTYTVKVNLPELLNRYGIWNGLTNAVWLITQSGDAWNRRRSCLEEGYILDYYGDGKSLRGQYSSYSEIDFEILKTGAYCPEYKYPPAYPHPLADPHRQTDWDLPYPQESPDALREIMVCCTNWDMACPQPPLYSVGCQDVSYKEDVFQAHRWDYWYKAITSKYPADDNRLFGGSYYYFQIVWKPEEIIWRIGPEKDQMLVVGYMHSGMTSIPNNQMLLIISQEFHNTDWWPGSPFPQGYIPFPGKDIDGYVYEISIE